MAPLTWRNVDAPNFSGVNSALALVGSALNNAQDSALKGIANYKADQVTAASNAAQLAAMKFQDPDAYAAALAAGTVLPAGINPNNLNKDSLDFLNTHAATLLDNNQKIATTGQTNAQTDFIDSNTAQNGVQTAGMQIANNKSAYDFGQQKTVDAAKLQAGPLLTSIQTDLASGDPAKIDSAKSRINANAGLFQQAGIDASSLVKGAVGETTTAIEGNNKLTSTVRSAADTKDANAGIDLGRQATTKFGTQAEAEASIRSNPNLTAVTRNAALKQIGEDAPAVYSVGPTTVDQDIAKLGTRPGEPVPSTNGQPLPVTANPNSAALVPASNSLVGIVDQTEGGANYSTLYGNAQNKGPLAGADVSKMSVGQVLQFSSRSGPYGAAMQAQGVKAAPVGRFQVINSTLQKVVKELGIDPNAPFDANTQNRIFNHLVDGRLAQSNTLPGQIAALRQEWDGFKNVPDVKLASAIQAYKSGAPIDMSALAGGSSGTSIGVPRDAVASNIANATAPGAPQPTNISLPNGQTMNQDTVIPNASDMLKAATVPLTAPIVNSPTTVNKPNPTIALAPTAAPASAAIAQAVTGNQPLEQTNAAAAQSAAAATPAPAQGLLTNILAKIAPTDSPLGKQIASQTKKAAPAAIAQAATAPAVATAGNAPIADQLQSLQNTSTVDKSFNSNSPLIAAIAAVPNQDETKPETVARILTDGQMKDVPPEAVTDAIQHVIDKTNLTPAAAGEFVKNAFYSKDLAHRIFGVKIPFFTWDQYGYASPNSNRGARIDEDAISKTLKAYFPERKDGTFDASSMVGAIQKKQQQNLGDTTLQQITQIASKAQALHDAQLQDTTGKVNKDAVELNYRAQIEQLRQKAAALGQGKVFESNLRAISAK